MKVVQVKSIPLSVPLERPVLIAGKSYLTSRFNPVVVQLMTDEGIDGFGIAFTGDDKRVKALKVAIDEVGEEIIGQDVFRWAENWQKLFTATAHMGHRGYGIYALSAIDTALWDIQAKAFGKPLALLLGGYRKEVQVYASHKLFRNWSLNELQKDAVSLVNQGFRAMKMKMGDKSLSAEVERIKVIREAVGDDIDIMIDANWAWTIPQAIKIGHALEPYNVKWLEDPLASDDADDVRQVATALDMSIAIGETYCTKYEFRQLMEKRASDILIVDLQRVGGVTEWMKVAAIAQAWNIPVASHLFHEFSVHLVAAIPNGLIVEYMPWWDFIYQEPPQVKDGYIKISGKPGLGLELDPDALKKYEMK